MEKSGINTGKRLKTNDERKIIWIIKKRKW